jgi:argininosuccinate synthase
VAFDAFVDSTQEHVSGEVRLRFSPGGFMVVGRRSGASLYDMGLATYGPEDAFDHRHADGFIRLWAMPLKVWSARQGRR